MTDISNCKMVEVNKVKNKIENIDKGDILKTIYKIINASKLIEFYNIAVMQIRENITIIDFGNEILGSLYVEEKGNKILCNFIPF